MGGPEIGGVEQLLAPAHPVNRSSRALQVVTELAPRPMIPDRQPRDPEETERNTGLVIYGLYLASPLTLGVSGLVGLLMAASKAGRAGGKAASHFRYQVWTFGGALGASLTGGLWATLGGLATLADRTGGDLALAGGALAIGSGLAFLGASAFGLSRLASHEPIGETR